jgi:hypothetical protein
MSWNGVRYRADHGDHVESYFLKATAPDAKRALWLKATIFSSADEPEHAVAEGWAVAFDNRDGKRTRHAVKHSIALSSASFGDSAYYVRWALPGGVDDIYMADGETHGCIHTGDDSIRWSLRFAGNPKPFVQLPHERLYETPLPPSKMVTPHPDVRFDGVVHINGESWELDGWAGMQGHNWGNGHAEQHTWCHCNQWENDWSDEHGDFVLEAVSARLRSGPVLTPPLTVVCVRHDGHDYIFNSPMSLLRADVELGLRRYAFRTSSGPAKISGLIEADVDDFAGLYYANPQGPMSYCLNAKLARARVRFELEGQPAIDLATSAAALEVCTRRPDHGVRMLV